MVFEVLATPVKPNKPAIIEIIKNIIAHFNIDLSSFAIYLKSLQIFLANRLIIINTNN